MIIQGKNGTYWTEKGFCTCMGFLVHGHCKHEDVVRKMVELDKIDKELKEMESSIDGLNKMFGSALYNSDEIVGVYGKAGVGKTLLIVQDAYKLASEGRNILVVDTEGGTTMMFKKWRDVMEARFPSKNRGKLFIESKRTFGSVYEYFGYRADVVFKQADKTGEKGSLEFRVVETLDEVPIEDFIEKEKIDMLVLDSVSAPIRAKIPLAQQNNPAKASAMALLLGKVSELQEKYRIGVLVTSHASFNPAGKELSTDAQSYGGIILHHFSKRVIYVDRREVRGMENYRRFWGARIEDEADLSRLVYVKYTDAGIEEIKEWKPEEVLTKGELEKLPIGEK